MRLLDTSNLGLLVALRSLHSEVKIISGALICGIKCFERAAKIKRKIARYDLKVKTRLGHHMKSSCYIRHLKQNHAIAHNLCLNINCRPAVYLQRYSKLGSSYKFRFCMWLAQPHLSISVQRKEKVISISTATGYYAV